MGNNIIDMHLIAREDVENIFTENPELALNIVIKAFSEKMKGTVLLPEKISQIFNTETQERTNCLVATLLTQKVSGVKWVSVFPTNTKKKLLNVSGVILLSSTETGYPLALIDGTYCTALRTAAVGALAAKYLSIPESEVIGFIGAGEQALMHFKTIKTVRNLKTCYVSANSMESEKSFVNKLINDYPDVKFVLCEGDHAMAAEKADIIVTAISSQAPLLKAKYVKKGATYIHVGGWEDEYAVAQKADKIICDNWESVKHRSQTLSRMYKEGLLENEDIHGNLDEIIFGELPGREHENEIIYFNSVGLAYIDIMFANEIYLLSKKKNNGINYRLQGN